MRDVGLDADAALIPVRTIAVAVTEAVDDHRGVALLGEPGREIDLRARVKMTEPLAEAETVKIERHALWKWVRCHQRAGNRRRSATGAETGNQRRVLDADREAHRRDVDRGLRRDREPERSRHRADESDEKPHRSSPPDLGGRGGPSA